MKRMVVVCVWFLLVAGMLLPCAAWAQSRDEGIRLFNQAMELEKTAKSSQDFDRVLETYQQALRIFERLKDDRGIAYTAGNMGIIYQNRGDYDRALELYNLELTLKRKLGDVAGEGRTLNNMAIVYRNRGNYDRALELYEQSLAIKRKLKDVAGEGQTLSGIGRIHQAVKRFDKALDCFQQALTINTRLKVPTDGTKNNIGTVYLDQGDLTKAEPLIKEGNYNVSLGRLALMKSDYQEALKRYNSLLQFQLKSRNADMLFAAYTGLGTAHENTRNDPQAAEHYQKAIEHTEEVRSSIKQAERGEFFNVSIGGFSRTAPYEGLARVLMRLNRPQEALKTSEFTKARVYGEAISKRHEHAGTDIPQDIRKKDESLTDQLAALSKNLQGAYAKENKEQIATIEPQVKEAKAKLAAHVEMLRKQYPLFAATKYPQPMDLAQTALKDGEWVVSYDVTDSGLLVYLTKGKQLVKAMFKPVPRKELDELVRKFREPLEVLDGDEMYEKLLSFDFAAGKKLADILLLDVLPEIPAGAPLIVVPDESLGSVPFEMLVLNNGASIGKDKRIPYVTGAEFLGDRHPISYYQSITALTLARTMIKQEKKQGERVMVMADPVFDDTDDRLKLAAREKDRKLFSSLPQNLMSIKNLLGLSFQRLPVTAQLARTVKQTFPQRTEVFEGLAASKPQLMKTDLRPFGSMVFATHGYFGTDLPGIMEPVLVLTLVDQPQGTDGFLRMSEVMGLKMNAEIVALTACQSGLGKQLSGEGTMGMGRAFQYAGARSALMSLWSVAETSSVTLVESFFKHLKAGKPKLEALKAARDEIRKAGYDHPFFWAPFILVGEVN